MDKFSSALRGYDKKEVNAFIDKIIAQVEDMVKELEDKNEKISTLRKAAKKNQLVAKKLSLKVKELKSELEVLNQKEELGKEYQEAILNLNKAKEDTKKLITAAKVKSRKIITDAEDNADEIIQECLLSAKKKEMELNTLKNEIEKLKQMKETLYYEARRESMVGVNR